MYTLGSADSSKLCYCITLHEEENINCEKLHTWFGENMVYACN